MKVEIPFPRRPLDDEETRDEQIEPDKFFGITGKGNPQVCQFDGVKVRTAEDGLTYLKLKAGETLRQALMRMPLYEDGNFVIHLMELPPGGYHPRVARPFGPDGLQSIHEAQRCHEVMIELLNQLRSLVGMLDAICQTVHPQGVNLKCYGSSIRNLLILACTECEAQWRGVQSANGYSPKNPKTTDYVKLCAPLRLPEYGVRLSHFPWIEPFMPYNSWISSAPTKTLPWYDDYNAAKHDREVSFPRASLMSAIQSVAAIWIMVYAQFGMVGIREFQDLHRYFEFTQVPRWRFSECYTSIKSGFSNLAGPQRLLF
jgi:hypothetical protein